MARRVAQLAQIDAGMRILEPSAGRGDLALAAVYYNESRACVVTIEKEAALADSLIAKSFDPIVADFLSVDPSSLDAFDRVVMNPPFTRGTDVKHVTHAFRFLKPGGRLVSIMSNGWRNNSDRASLEFRELVDRFGVAVEDVPAGDFKQSGTNIATCIVILEAVPA